jgi:hypothetical protein
MSTRHWRLALLGAVVLTVVFAVTAVVKLRNYALDVERAPSVTAEAEKPNYTPEKLAKDLFKGLAMTAGFAMAVVFVGALILRSGFAFQHSTTYLFLLAGVVTLIHQIGARDWLWVSLGAVMVIYGIGDLAICRRNHVHTSGRITVDQVAGL